ncbi:MAG: MarR family transcriptional regulator [Gemmatimonadales bacterium]|jgi:predicted ArsR family transcriptional regulator
MREAGEVRIPGLGDTQRQLLLLLKRRGPSTTAELADECHLAQGTLREHLYSLDARGLIERAGSRRQGPGRPRVVYRLSDVGESLFPSNEAELLAAFVQHLLATGRAELVDRFFEQRSELAYAEAAPALEGVPVEEREREAVRVLKAAGFMPELLRDEATGEMILQLCNCPLKSVIAITRRPCAAEEKLVAQLVDARIERFAYMPEGDDSCSYRIRRAPAAEEDDAQGDGPTGQRGN